MLKGLFENRYKILKLLGEGGMGKVYLADDKDSGNNIALKTIHPEVMDEETIRTFKSEFSALAVLDHPNLGKVFDFGTTAEGTNYFTMEYVKGLPLNLALKDRGDFDRLSDFVLQICSALDYIHQRGIIHFDLKPGNIMVNEQEYIKILDFGLASRISGSEKITAKGTLEYMAPEMLLGERVDSRADLYSLGIILFELIAGRLPFEQGETPKETINAIIGSNFSSVNDYAENVPCELSTLVNKLIRKDRELRLPAAREVIEILHSDEISDISLSGSIACREKELDFVRGFLSGDGSNTLTMIIEGSKNYGKTALLNEFKKECQLSGMGVVFIDAADVIPEKDISLIFLVLRQLMRISENMEMEQDEITDIEKEIKSGSMACNSTCENKIKTLLNGLFLMNENKDKAILIDNFHLADEMANRILASDLFSEIKGRNFICLTTEHGETLKELSDNIPHNTKKVMLKPFDNDEIKMFCRISLGNDDIPKMLTDWLMTRTEGVPGTMLEALNVLVKKGVLYRSGGSWMILSEKLSGIRFKSSGENEMDSILNSFAPEKKKSLQFISVFKDGFNSAVLNGKIKKSEEFVEELIEKKILEKKEGLLNFTNNGFRSFIYFSIDDNNRKKMHTDAAAYIKDAGALSDSVDYHLNRGENPDDSLRASLQLCKRPEISTTESIEICRNALSHSGYNSDLYTDFLVILSILLVHYRSSGELEICKDLIKRARKLFRGNKLYEASLDYEEGINAFFEGNIEEAENHFRNGLEVWLEIKDYKGISKHYCALGNICIRKNDLAGVEKNLNTALDSAGHIDDPDVRSKEQLVILNSLGSFYGSSGDMNRAEDCFKKTYDLALTYNRKDFQARAANNLGVIFEEKGQYPEALKYYSDSLEIKKEIDDKPGQAMTWENMGVIYEYMGRCQSAMDCYRKASDIYNAIRDQKSLAECLGKIGTVYLQMGYISEAMEKHREVISIAADTKDERLKILAEAKIIGELAQLGRFKEASELRASITKIDHEKIGDYLCSVYLLESESIYFGLIGQFSGAYDAAERALKCIEEKNIERMRESLILRMAEICLLLPNNENFINLVNDCSTLNDISGSIYLKIKREMLEEKYILLNKNSPNIQKLRALREAAKDSSFKLLEAEILLIMAEAIISSTMAENYLKEVERINNSLNIPSLKWTSSYLKGIYYRKTSNSVQSAKNFINAASEIDNSIQFADNSERISFLKIPLIADIYRETSQNGPETLPTQEADDPRIRIYNFISETETAITELGQNLERFENERALIRKILELSAEMQSIKTKTCLIEYILLKIVEIADASKVIIFYMKEDNGVIKGLGSLIKGGVLTSTEDINLEEELNSLLLSENKFIFHDVSSEKNLAKTDYFLGKGIQSVLCFPFKFSREDENEIGSEKTRGGVYIERTSVLKSGDNCPEAVSMFIFQAESAFCRFTNKKEGSI